MAVSIHCGTVYSTERDNIVSGKTTCSLTLKPAGAKPPNLKVI